MQNDEGFETSEQRRIDHLVEYFEGGCLCLITGRIKSANTKGQDAENYYMENCTCSRHPESATRYCWDRVKILTTNKTNQ